jgi:hypothetical protein
METIRARVRAVELLQAMWLDRGKSPSTLRYFVCVHQKSLGFSAVYPALFHDVSMLKDQ